MKTEYIYPLHNHPHKDDVFHSSSDLKPPFPSSQSHNPDGCCRRETLHASSENSGVDLEIEERSIPTGATPAIQMNPTDACNKFDISPVMPT